MSKKTHWPSFKRVAGIFKKSLTRHLGISHAQILTAISPLATKDDLKPIRHALDTVQEILVRLDSSNLERGNSYGFNKRDRIMLEAVYNASVFGKEPNLSQSACIVRQQQVEYGLNLYRPSSRHNAGVSFRAAAKKAIEAPQFANVCGAYKIGEVHSLARAINRAFYLK